MIHSCARVRTSSRVCVEPATEQLLVGLSLCERSGRCRDCSLTRSPGSRVARRESLTTHGAPSVSEENGAELRVPCATVRIVAIGGGEIGRPGYPVELTAIDAEVVRLTGKRRPLVIFLPTATQDDPVYTRTIEEHYGGRLGCRVHALTLCRRRRSPSELGRTIASADIVYVGGGNTLRMMKLWRRRGVARLLVEAAANGTVMAGVSAGAICWCTAGVSDSRSFTAADDAWPYIAVRGLGLLDLLLCPHYDAEPRRQPALQHLLPRARLPRVGLDDCTALEVIDDRYRILSCREGSSGHVVDRSGARRDVPAHDDLRPLAELR